MGFVRPNLPKALHFYLYAVSPRYRRYMRVLALQSRHDAPKPSYFEGTLAGPFCRDVKTYTKPTFTVPLINPSTLNGQNDAGVGRISEPKRVLTGEDDGYRRLDLFHFVLEEDAAKGRLVQFEPRKPPSILDIAVLACVVHAARPQEQLVERQCLWYAYMVYEILLKVFGAQRPPEEHVVLVESTDKDDKHGRMQSKHKPRRCIASVVNPSELLKDRSLLEKKFEADVAMARDGQRIKTQIEHSEIIENFRLRKAMHEKEMQRLNEEGQRKDKALEEMTKESKRLDERITMGNRELEEMDMKLKEMDKEIQRLRDERRLRDRPALAE
ncbi:hypothetical protein BKA70DRAFT_1227180 [Coprinopsis sp. MPI-PUGE-AT-0042]|nr:hypothetical protein BKA70DRAFT_1227180 [Coprinopsis sp. MPI-PUGE-AT-0042]